MLRHKLILILALAGSLVACSSGLHPVDELKAAQSKLLGKWQAKGSIFSTEFGLKPTYSETQFEFFADGSIAESGKSRRGWQQERAGTFKFADATHVKVDLGWEYGVTIYRVNWKDNDHVTLRAADSLIIPLHRIN